MAKMTHAEKDLVIEKLTLELAAERERSASLARRVKDAEEMLVVERRDVAVSTKSFFEWAKSEAARLGKPISLKPSRRSYVFEGTEVFMPS